MLSDDARVHSTTGSGTWTSMANDVEALLVVNLTDGVCAIRLESIAKADS